MLTQICQYLRNWFDTKSNGTPYPRYSGEFTIAEGEVVSEVLADGQYIRIMDSLLNDGVHLVGSGGLKDEVFTGSIQLMSIPAPIIVADAWAETWMEKNGGADSSANSPYNSESFAGYSYSKGNNSKGQAGVSVFDQAQFISMLAPWRKI